MFFLINNMIVPGSTYWNMVFGREPGEVWKDVEGINTVNGHSYSDPKLRSANTNFALLVSNRFTLWLTAD